MSDQINQIQATFNGLEDRILLKFKTLNDHVYPLWVTRRFCKLLLPALHGLHPLTGEFLLGAETHLKPSPAKEDTDASSASFESYQTPEKPQYPLGEDPLLLTKIRFQDLNLPTASFLLEPNQGQGLVLPFHRDLTRPLLKILNQAVDNAEWDLAQELRSPSSPLLQ
ncbi:MAG: hypothetical protein JXR44_06305 [Thiotrichales bacterium]|nr:hypothetical protein [Thiotrichales bacterium]